MPPQMLQHIPRENMKVVPAPHSSQRPGLSESQDDQISVIYQPSNEFTAEQGQSHLTQFPNKYIVSPKNFRVNTVYKVARYCCQAILQERGSKFNLLKEKKRQSNLISLGST